MFKKFVSYIIIAAMMTTLLPAGILGYAASTNDGTVYTDTWVPGTDAGQTGDANKLSVITSSAEGESFYLYTSVTGVADAPLIYRQRTVALIEMTFMLTESNSSIGYMPVFYDKNKATPGEIWTQMMTISPSGGVVISNITDAGSNKVFTGAETGWANDKFTLVSSVSLNKKHTIRVEHDPDNLKFTIRLDGHAATLRENSASAYVASTKTGSADAHNAKGPRFVFKASAGKSFKVYDMYMRGTVAANTNTSKAVEVFSGARAYTYEGELKATASSPANGSYGIRADEKDMYILFNHPLMATQPNDFEIDISYTSDGNSYTQVPSDGYTHSIDGDNKKLDISFVENLKKGVTYKVLVKNVYSAEGNPLASYSFSFITDDGTTDILNAVNNATNIRNLGIALNTYKSDIGLSGADYTNVNTNRNLITWVSRHRPFTRVEDIKTAAQDAAEMKTALDASDETTISSFIDSYDHKLFDDTAAYDKYTAFSDMYKAMAESMIIAQKPFSTLIDFIDGFNASVNSISVAVPSVTSDADKLICDFTKTGVAGWAPSNSSYSFINEATPDFAPGITLGRYYVPETTTNQYRMDFQLPYNDVSDCEALYIWAYSPAASGKQFALVPFCEDTPSWVYFSKLMSIDFSGWKLITIPLSSFTGTRNPSWSDIKEIRIAQAGMGLNEALGGTEIYFAKMWFGAKSTASSFTMVNSNAYSGTENFGISDTLEFEFSGSVYFNPGNPPYIADSAGNKVSANVSANGSTLLIDPVSNLDANTTYTVNLNDVCTYGAFKYQSSPITFTTADVGLSASKPQFSVSSLPASGSVSAAVSLSNTSLSSVNAELIIAAYDENGRMIKSAVKECSVGAGVSDKTAVATINLASYDGVTLRAFTINKTDKSKPVNQKLAVLKDTNAPLDKTYESFDKTIKFSSGNIAVKDILVDLDKITVKSCINQNISVPLTIKVYDSVDTLKYISQVSTDANGCSTVELSFDPDLDESGRYRVEISSMSMTNASPVVAYFHYIDADDRANVLDLINSSTTEAGIASVLNTNKEQMSISNVDYTSADNMYISHVIFRDKPYGTYSDVLEKYKKAVLALDAINNSYWSVYSEIIENNKNIIFDTTEVYDAYNSLGSDTKNIIAQSIYTKRPFKSFDAFVNAISLELPSGGSSSPSTGPSAPSSPKGGYTTDTSAGGTSVPVSDKYIDLWDCAWAESYIYNLKDSGVLTMGADKKFRPNDNITREEYVKMLVLSLNIPLSGDVAFNDVDKNAWYYTYISAAYSAGIVNGVDADRFGIGEYITREQMAAMACRALNVTDTSDLSVTAFSDDSEISDYAKQAVYYMQNKGIINGIGNNLFAPKANASRAQAAKIISMVSGL